MGKVMMTLQWPHAPTVEEICGKLGLAKTDIDGDFGVVEVDPDDHLYTFMVDEQKASEIAQNTADVEGPYANPRIAPFGPP